MKRSSIVKSALSLAIAAPLMALPVAAIATPKHCPPGHAKKGWCDPGERYDRTTKRKQVEYRYIDDYDRYGLKRPRSGHAYVVWNEELYLINRATQEVIEGLGALSYLLGQ